MAIVFAGGQYFYVIDDAIFNTITTAVTHMCWVTIPQYPTSSNQGAFAFYGHSATSSNGYAWEMGVLPSPGLIVCETTTNSGLVDPTSASGISLNTWTHVAASWDSGSQTTKIYINGALSSSTSVPGTTLSTPTSGPFTVAVDLNVGITHPQQELIGTLEDIRVYSRLLSAAEINTIWATRGRDGIVNNLVVSYRLDELSVGTTVTVSGIKDCSTNNVAFSNLTGSPSYALGQSSFTRNAFING
jgi:hypothetical protein